MVSKFAQRQRIQVVPHRVNKTKVLKTTNIINKYIYIPLVESSFADTVG